MTHTLTQAEAIQIDLDNLYFTRRYLKGCLDEMEYLGKTHTKGYKLTKHNLEVTNSNIRHLAAQLEKL